MESMHKRALIGASLLATGATVAQAQAVGHRVNINGMRMYYEVSGTGDPLVVLPGAYMNIPMMGAIIPRLARTHKVYAVELQGHGRTTDIARGTLREVRLTKRRFGRARAREPAADARPR
jgi:pimeloyl-ACP methyl ester carboxylesterase